MKYAVFFILLTLFACSEKENPVFDYSRSVDGTTSKDMSLTQVWICHSVDPQIHGLASPSAYACTSQCSTSPESDFCWLLQVEDCQNITLEWQKENCHFFQ